MCTTSASIPDAVFRYPQIRLVQNLIETIALKKQYYPLSSPLSRVLNNSPLQ